jgi:hypothetical protein
MPICLLLHLNSISTVKKKKQSKESHKQQQFGALLISLILTESKLPLPLF